MARDPGRPLGGAGADDLFAAGELADAAEAQAAKDKAFRALNSLLRYKGRIEREHRAAMAALEALRERRLAGPAARPSEPEPTIAQLPPRAKETATKAPVRSEPERLNRHQRRALQAMERQRSLLAA